MINKYAISLRKNVRIATDAQTSNGNYDVLTYKAFRSFPTRAKARSFKKHYSGSPVVIVNRATNQVVR